MKDFLNGTKLNQINGVQYPYGFTRWLKDVAKVLQIEHRCFGDNIITIHNCHEFVMPKNWYPYF